jgi:voltage-gated potassium channel Kch
MKAIRTAINEFFVRNDIVWEALMGVLVVVWLLLGAEPRRPIFGFAADAITVFFALEFTVRFLATYDHRGYLRGHWIDVVTLIPALRGFRLLRLLRMLRLIRATRGLANAVGVLEYLAGDLTIKSLFTIWFSVTVIASLMFYVAESAENPNVNNIFDAGWWALVTATTVGYGDIFPVTVAGRVAGVVMMLVGIATFSALAGLIGSALQRRRAEIAAGMTEADIEEADEAGGSGSAPADPAYRLRRLATLRDEGLITSEEYDTRRAAVVSEL